MPRQVTNVRLTRTSAGFITVDFGASYAERDAVTVTTFGEDGWERAGATWSPRGHHHAGETLAEFLAEFTGVPAVEAELLAADIAGPWLGEWGLRGSERERRQFRRIFRLIMAAVFLILALAVLGVVALAARVL